MAKGAHVSHKINCTITLNPTPGNTIHIGHITIDANDCLPGTDKVVENSANGDRTIVGGITSAGNGKLTLAGDITGGYVSNGDITTGGSTSTQNGRGAFIRSLGLVVLI